MMMMMEVIASIIMVKWRHNGFSYNGSMLIIAIIAITITIVVVSTLITTV